ncbi:Methyltransferase type 11 [Trypanosoma melophagium]|uniref:Methyltransferase type 11 n=1 Tax=Trypanosoma melophagium TaxID=715481 RepID=UPI00351A2598|nr:Methyltransferase type 11 [Trypanosoma melophagium]
MSEAREGMRGNDVASSGPPFNPPLYIQRAHEVYELLQKHQCFSFIDAGCSRGDLLRFLLISQLCEYSFSNVVAIDVDENSLREASRAAPPSVSMSPVALLHPMKVNFVLGDLTRPSQISSTRSNINEQKTLESDISFPLPSSHFDAVISIEVLEHINPTDVPAFTDVLFAHHAVNYGVRIIVITTPNRDRNVTVTKEKNSDGLRTDSICPSNSFWVTGVPYQVRNADHKFEMTAAQFRYYCDYVVEAYKPFVTSYTLFGVGGNFTQGAVFYTKFYSSYSFSRADTKDPNFSSKILKKSVSQNRNHLKREQDFSISLNLNAETNDFCWVHDINNRARLFPWGAIFGELSGQPTDFKPLLCRTPGKYRSLVSVEVPYLSLWERLENAMRESFSSAARNILGNRRYTHKIRFGDVVKSESYLIVAPFNASLCALTNSLLEQEVRYKKEAERKTYLLSTSVVSQVRMAGSIYSVLHWLLHKYWGKNKLRLYLQNDTYGSTKEALSQDEIILISFLVTAGFLKEIMVNISYFLQEACRIKVRAGRNSADRKEETTNEQLTNDIAGFSVDRKRLHHMAKFLSECGIPVHPFVDN